MQRQQSIGEAYYGPDTMSGHEHSQPSPQRMKYLATHRDGYNDCKAGRSPRYCINRGGDSDAYLQGWQDANAEAIRQSFAN